MAISTRLKQYQYPITILRLDLIRTAQGAYPTIDSSAEARTCSDDTQLTSSRTGPSRRPRERDGRMRSRSPPAIDRYQPQTRGVHERRDDRNYRRRSPPPAQPNIDRYVPGQGQVQEPIQLINPLANPLSGDIQVGFSYFAEWWRKDKEIKEEKARASRGERRPPTRLKSDQEMREEKDAEHDKIQVAYDEYKNKHQAQLGRQFVVAHKNEEWFKEKYDSEIRDPIRKRQVDYRREVYAQWEADLESGMFDEFSLEGIYKNDSNGEGGMIDKEEGEAAAANEVLGVGDLLPLKGGDLRDEAINQPALLIKTIAPYVSREKLEAFCKEHLGEGEGGLKYLSLSDPLPLKKFHRLGWIILNPGGEQTVEVEIKAQRSDGRDEDGENGEDGSDAADKMETSGTETVTKSGADIALEAINGKAIEIEDGNKTNFTCHVGAHYPPPIVRKRALWDLFSAPERVERDLQLAVRLVMKLESEIGDDINAVSKIEERVEAIKSSGLLQPQTNGTSTQHKAENGEADEDGEMEEEEEGAYDEEIDDEELLSKKKRLDLLVEYLRRVHSFCFFCVFDSDSVHELTRRCPGGHLRRPRASLTNQAKIAARASAYSEPFPLKKTDTADQDPDVKEESSPAQRRYHGRYQRGRTFLQLQRAFNWVKTYESKLFQILEPGGVDIKELGGEPIEEGLEKNLKKYVTQEDESKFRCKVPDCSKLFKGENFWRKHVEKRHTEWFEKQKKDVSPLFSYFKMLSEAVQLTQNTDSIGKQLLYGPCPHLTHRSHGPSRPRRSRLHF